jgi:hypothetical protein
MKYILLPVERFAESLKAELSTDFLTKHQDCGAAHAQWAKINAAFASGELTSDFFTAASGGIYENTDRIYDMISFLKEELIRVGIQEFKKACADYLSGHPEVDYIEIEHSGSGWGEPEEWDRYDSITINGHKIHNWEISTSRPDLKEEFGALCRFPSEILIEEYGMGAIKISRDGVSFCAPR